MSNNTGWQDYVVEKGVTESLPLMSDNLCLKSDSYKGMHWQMLPEGTTNFFSYGESRGSGHGIEDIVVWNLSAIVKRYFTKRLTHKDVERANRFFNRHIGPGSFNYEGWMYIVEEYDGFMPFSMWGVPEGTVMSPRLPIYYIEVNDPKCAWLSSFFEPLFLQSWYGITVASLSYAIRKLLGEFWKETVDEDRMGGINFALHDFGFRGVSSDLSAGSGGSGHLLNFMGTDTLMAIAYLYDFYGLDEEDDASMPAFSVFATEHSVTCANSDAENRNDYAALEMAVSLLEKRNNIFKGSIVSAVADTYDVYRYTNWVGTDFKERIEKSGGRFVVRPDSGDPTVVPVQLIEMLLNSFGYTVNSKGFKVLPDCIRVLQGDGITIDTIRQILLSLRAKGISAENIVFGMGGGLLQHCDRDWLKVAQKGSAIEIDGVWKDLFKDPITDKGKQSKKGRVVTILRDGKYDWCRIEDIRPTDVTVMVPYYDGTGVCLQNEPFSVIKNRVQSTL